MEIRDADRNPEAVEAFEAVSSIYEAFDAGDIATFADGFVDVDP